MTNSKLYDAIIECLNNMSTDDLVNIHNEYCEADNDPDDRIESMIEFDDLLYGKKPSEIAEIISGQDFNVSDNYFWFTIYGVESADFADDMPIYREDIAKYIEEEHDSLYNDEIQEIIDEYEEEEEEEDEEEEDEEDEEEED